MLNIKSLNIAKASAVEVLEKNLLLSTKSDTMLSRILATSVIPIDTAYGDMDEALLYEETVVYTSDEDDSPSNHTALIGDATDTLSSIVLRHISTARSVVKPRVEEFSEKLSAFIETNKVVDPVLEFDIVPKSIPKLMSNTLLTDEVDKYNGTIVISPDIKTMLPELSIEEIVKLMLTGSSVDEDILGLVSIVGEDTVKDLYMSFFTTIPTAVVYTAEDITRLDVYDRLHYMLVVYLLARKLIAEVPDKTWDVSLPVYTNALSQLRDYAGSEVYNTSFNLARLVRTKQLIIRKGRKHKSIVVNGVVYAEWLKEGGTPEILLGVMVDGCNDTSINSINKKTDEYLKTWNSYVAYKKSRDGNRLLGDIKDFIPSLYLEMSREVDEIETAYAEANIMYEQNASKMLNEYVVDLKTRDLEDVDHLALLVIAKIRFYYTSSYAILGDMQEASIVNPNITPREAALLATINYLSDYVSDQIATKSWV